MGTADFYTEQHVKTSLNSVMRAGTFSGTYGANTYMGVRFDKDRVFLLNRMLKGEVRRDENKEFIITFRSTVKPASNFTIRLGEWYVVDMSGNIYMMYLGNQVGRHGFGLAVLEGGL